MIMYTAETMPRVLCLKSEDYMKYPYHLRPGIVLVELSMHYS